MDTIFNIAQEGLSLARSSTIYCWKNLCGFHMRLRGPPKVLFDLRATHARTFLPAALASVSFGFVLVRVRVRRRCGVSRDDDKNSLET